MRYRHVLRILSCFKRHTRHYVIIKATSKYRHILIKPITAFVGTLVKLFRPKLLYRRYTRALLKMARLKAPQVQQVALQEKNEVY
jgi:hypothetical protein